MRFTTINGAFVKSIILVTTLYILSGVKQGFYLTVFTIMGLIWAMDDFLLEFYKLLKEEKKSKKK